MDPHHPPQQQGGDSNSCDGTNGRDPQMASSAAALLLLREELDRTQEANFDLTATVATLQVELSHTTRTLQGEAARQRSQLEHELRLAQREAQRWKAAAAAAAAAASAASASSTLQHQLQHPQPRSIVRPPPPATTTAAASAAAAAAPADYDAEMASSPTEAAAASASGHDVAADPTSTSLLDGDAANGTVTVAGKDPVRRLAQQLLLQTPFEDDVGGTVEGNDGDRMDPSFTGGGGPATHPSSNTTPTTATTNHHSAGTARRSTASHIRQVLVGISTTSEYNNGRSRWSGESDDDDGSGSSSNSCGWTEARLADWLIRQSSPWMLRAFSPSTTTPKTAAAATTSTTTTTTTPTPTFADRCCFTVLLQSPAARQYVVETTAGGAGGGDVDPTNTSPSDFMDVDAVIANEGVSGRPTGTGTPMRQLRTSRIRPMEPVGGDDAANGEAEAHQQLHQRYQQTQDAIRRAMRDPWWTPSSHPVPRGASFSAAPPEQRAEAFQGWVGQLASSQHPLHLQTLLLILADDIPPAGRSAFSVPSTAGTVWWEVCYPGVAATIERIILRRRVALLRSFGNDGGAGGHPRGNGKQQRQRLVPLRPSTSSSSSAAAATSSSSLNGRRNQGGVAAGGTHGPTRHHNDHRRRRIGNVERRLELLSTMAETGVPASRPGPDDRGVPTEHNESPEKGREDEVLALALDVWTALIEVTPWEWLKAWCEDETGLALPADATTDSKDVATDGGVERSETIGDSRRTGTFRSSTSPPPSCVYMVALLLDFLEDLQFVQWEKTAMAASGVPPTGRTPTGAGGNEKKCDGEPSFDANDAIPGWYTQAVAVLAQIGRTEGGMRILRTRLPDDQRYDWMGNALDVSIRQLHALTLHWDDIRDGEIVYIGLPFKGGRVRTDGNAGRRLNGPQSRLERSVEGWIRLWHQALLFVQHNEAMVEQQQKHHESDQPYQQISFRSLMLDLQDWYTSACAILLTSDETRPAIQSMIRLQLEELAMDEEEHDEMKRSL